MAKLATLDLLTHVRNVFSGLVLAGTQSRMEQTPTVVVVERRGLSEQHFITSSFKTATNTKKTNWKHRIWLLSPCSTLSRLDRCHRSVEKRPVLVCSTCSQKKMSRIHAGSFQPLREKHLGTKWFSECYFGISSLFSPKFTPSTLFSARLRIQHCCFRTLVAMQSLLATSFTPC